ncbi:MAG: protein-L-isoaspartate(D-aspartate) O-methyltransferase [Tolumonas sp.]|uniref:protein-L-isoaspartate(D-aspartate) O-methyltransferase n=1 Tax=uncultured Tolumonas sp. TaxID=263765 RepID=UPI002A0A9157|nr:protein-L-isoaspartate(D-aspartate) O-methyltransferase [uncultured Tolumonas sp.]MDD2341972.1 protein-L-isoaspartate(D-aspartate) O-methyltransferase [Tolumonas sp.]MDD2842025.1 protein-L-isoaspartate(D-aspartate) O-methyltransferase [Tolumonas sp.]
MRGTVAYLLIKQLQELGIRDERVLSAMASVPRNYFVDEAISHQAWDNTALPIGFGQTISQPYIVARMTEQLIENNPQSVLEVGTGSGYQTAVLSQLIPHVYSVERIKALQYQARRRLQRLDLHNVSMRHGDGWAGWTSKAPFDAIIVTAAAEKVPEALLAQLADGGRMVIPVGEYKQELLLIEKYGNKTRTEVLEAVRFVPLVHGELM